jgi:hypothetical protein
MHPETFVLFEPRLPSEMGVAPLFDCCELIGRPHEPRRSEAALQQSQVR